MDKKNSSNSVLRFSSFELLKEAADIKIPASSIEKLLDVMQKLKAQIEKIDSTESQFMFMYRYIIAINKLKNFAEFIKNKRTEKFRECLSTAKIYMTRLEELEATLPLIYAENQRKLDESCKEYKRIVFGDTKPEPVKDPVKPLSIDSKALFELFNPLWTIKNDKNTVGIHSKKFLIIDVRPRDHYAESKVISNSVSIPDEVIRKGKSASSLGLDLDDVTHAYWRQRDQYEKVILMDWRSRLDKLDPNSKLAILRDIMMNWDPGTNYKNPVLVLDGGYEDLILKYPKVSTNPKVDIPTFLNNTATPSLMDFEYPMAMLEDEVKPRPRPSVPSPILPARSPSPPEPEATPPEPSTPPVTNLPSRNPILTVNRANKPKTYSNLIKFKQSLELSKIGGKGDLSHSEENSEVIKLPSEHPAEEPAPPDSSPNAIMVSSDSESEFNTVPEEVLNDLRKKKPASMEVGIPDVPVKSSGDNDEDIVHYPLKEEGSSSNLRRSHSSPNVAKMEEEEAPASKPIYSRANKPVEQKQPFTSYIMGERTDSTYGKTALGLTGLKNFANNCYMNSIMQCLSNTEALVKELVRFDKPTVNTNSPTRGRVANEVIATFRSLWSGDVKCYSLRELKNLMGSYQEIYRGSNHQDSHEFLIILLEYLHNDLNIPAEVTVLAGAQEETGEKAWGEFRRKNCSSVQRLFCGQERSTVNCATCGHSSVTFGQFFQLAVPIPSGDRQPSLASCISLYLAGERIHGWHCPNCNTSRDAFKKIDITKLPPVLVIALKRFSQEGGSWLEKRECLVTYPLTDLNMREHTVLGSEQRHSSYNLHALSTHTGSLRAGHYRAIARNHHNSKWYMFDDASIYQMSPIEVANIPEVYILFYHAVQ